MPVVPKNQHVPVTPGEHVLRRIPNNKDWYKESLAEPVQRVAFEPRKTDTAGLSVFRELFVSAAKVAAGGPGRAGYYVSRLRIADLLMLGLTVVPDPQANELPGHALIPELSYSSMLRDRSASKAFQRELAKLASRAIVFRPGH
ncbi:MAG: hypothetical protein ACRED0_03805 [Gammaproteobacteria bacterium]